MAVVHIFKKWHWWSQLLQMFRKSSWYPLVFTTKENLKLSLETLPVCKRVGKEKNDKAVILTGLHLSLERHAYWSRIGVQLLYHGLRSLEAPDFKSYCGSSYLCICSTLGQIWWLVSLKNIVFWLNCQEYIWTGISQRINPIRNLILF